jgi:hypothetical protein
VTPVQLAALAVAKRAAQPFANAVISRSRHHIGLLTAELSHEEMVALAVLLAEADDDGTVPGKASHAA